MALYVLVTVGWVILIAGLGVDDPEGPGIAAASPFLAASLIGILGVESGGPSTSDRAILVAFTIFWTVAYAAAAWGLWAAAVASFDGCLGRMPGGWEEDRHPPRIDPGAYGLGYHPAPRRAAPDVAARVDGIEG